MKNRLCYSDAVKLLGGADNQLVAALDRITGGVLLGATGFGAEFVLSLFDAKGELARLSGESVSLLAERLRGLGRFDRTQRLIAAHKVIVLTAFFEAVHEVTPRSEVKELLRGRLTQVSLATGERPASGRLADLVAVLHDSALPGDPIPPGAETMPESLLACYASLSGRLVAYLAEALPGLSGELVRALEEEVPQAALRRYEEHLRRLTTDFPEVAFWANRLDHLTTHDRLLRLQAGLEGLGRVLDAIASNTAMADERRAALARRYRRALDRPVVTSNDIPEGLTMPLLAHVYVNPCFRVAKVTYRDRMDHEQWWGQWDVRDDLQEFLIGHLTSPEATRSPLIVLGQPGSGKSVLTQVLAARLPVTDFLTVRVVLRDVPADTDLQSQIEYAIRDATGESLSWPVLARTAGGALPVILLDGFDELLQATGIGQTDYLEQIVRFQEREADQGRPVAVLVTSRIAVADRGRIPRDGATALRLEPFTEGQVEQWLSVWDAANADHLVSRGLRPLPVATALRQAELASQPLLLLMLVLYDAADNALQRDEHSLDHADLYERILRRFAEREIVKSQPGLAAEPLEAAVNEELLRLSVAAFAMFNRGRQWVTDDELSGDLTELLGDRTPGPSSRDFHAAASLAQQIVGRFFFIHQAQALRKDQLLTTCEFLHATFGEFLVARLILRELHELAEVAAASLRRVPDDGFIRALLSFAPLTTRTQILDFLSALAERLPDERRRKFRELLLTAFQHAMEPDENGHYATYRPVDLGAPARHAAYAANLLLAMVRVGGPVSGRELFPEAPSPVAEWRKHALLWRSQFGEEPWEYLIHELSLRRDWEDGEREVHVDLRSDEPYELPHLDIFWTFNVPPGHEEREYAGWCYYRGHELAQVSHFTCDLVGDIAWHALAEVNRVLDQGDLSGDEEEGATPAFGILSPDRAVSVTNALTRVWLASSAPGGDENLQQAYEECLTVIAGSRAPDHQVARYAYLSRVLRMLAADRDRLPSGFRAAVLDRLRKTILQESYLATAPLVRRWAEEAFGDLGRPTP
ncbi:NACHT domain-containing NTPase [Nonomuraea sp. AD125B]|uniref:NACHT domain-containing protein n=1 Tax=Nonomuraea sp. AD125B TaxID=3242897 RepID=UPI00352965BE